MRASHTGEGSRAGVAIGEQARTSHIGEGFPSRGSPRGADITHRRGFRAGVVIGEQAWTSHIGEGSQQGWS